ncbi:TraG family conjugative transposon ATPase [Mucilaginibacter sp. RS28]|uniref:TraG family conjugative transposon ATPase n=1 Tax=Mucilaginibacter straminoryzae TaxID=2932774 RepID=A0A9X2B741_9SPHI|nr:TraG family conjugative transposon ATPase [Mucilaginibacter straminoryzae]MCJ8208109.1 TraG family conjugative transposon ATPase [Mucilaginibacter straminoryzae]
MKPAIDIEKVLPVWKVENDCLLSVAGDITLAWEAQLPEIFSLSAPQYEDFHQAWIKAIRLLPPHTVFHKQDWFMAEKMQARFADDLPFLARASERFFNERPFLNHRCYVLLTFRNTDRKPASSLFSNLLRRNLAPLTTVNALRLQSLLDTAGQFQRLLQDSGFVTLQRLDNNALAGLQDKTGLVEQYLQLLGPQAIPVIKDISFEQGLQIGADHCRLFTLADVADLPPLCGSRINYDKYSTDKTKFSTGFAAPLGQLLSCNHIYNQYIFVPDGPKTLKLMEAKRRRLQSLSAYSRENAIARDATQDFLNEAISQQRMPVKAHFNVLVWTDQEAGLKEMHNAVGSAMAQLDARAKEETVAAPQIWWAGLPGNEGDFPMNDTFDTFTEQACCFLNLETAYRSSDSPFGIRLGDRLTGVPVHVDISDEPMRKGITTNRNKIVIGGSGSGKSMFMNHLLHSYVQQGTHCIVVDVGHSYEGLCQLVNGYYFTYSEESPIRFNPFYIPAGDMLDTEKKESIKTLLVALWKQSDEAFRRAEYVAISNALQSYYRHLDRNGHIFPCFDSFYEFLQEHFISELATDGVKDRDFDLNNFLYVLRPYYKGGEFDYLLNATENLDVMHQPFIVFELDNVKDHPILFPVITLIIMEMFVSKMRKLKGVRKVICIEEAWKAIARSGMAEFMKYLYKTVRKYFGEAITVTQEIDDLITSPIIKEAIINNADCKILLDMRKFTNKFADIQAVLGMSDKGKEQVLSINKANDPTKKYREVYIDLGNQLMKVYRYEPSTEEYYAYSTEQTEKLKVQEYARRYGDIRRGLAALAADLRSQTI